MAIFTNLPVYNASYILLLSVSRAMPDLPRDCRYTIGQDVRNKITEVIIMIYRANRIKRKLDVIEKMRETILEVQVYIRLMCDLRYISEGRYLEWAEQTASISKQLSAWEKSELRKQSDGKDS